MRKAIIAAAIIFCLSAFVIYFRWSSAIHQPLEFSHAEHVRNGLTCEKCHSSLSELPTTAVCKTCHTQKDLPADVQWTRVYRVAPDVIFDHANHRDDCSTCHQEFTSAQRWIHEKRFPMDFCMKCHEARRANNACGACHKNR